MKTHIVGWPNTGTNHLNRLLAYYLDGPNVPPHDWSHPHPRIPKHHTRPRSFTLGDDERLVFIWRDPRDTVVSNYFYYTRFIEDGYIENFTLLDFIRSKFALGWQQTQIGWAEYMMEWLTVLEAAPQIARISHEELVNHRIGGLICVLNQLGISEPDMARVNYAVNLVKNRKRQPYIRRADWHQQPRTVPAGRPGEWKRHFDQRSAKFLEDYCGDIMAQLGYGGDECWAALLEN